MNRLNHVLLFLIAAAICLAIALLIATGTVTSSHADAWLIGGLLSFVLAHIG